MYCPLLGVILDRQCKYTQSWKNPWLKKILFFFFIKTNKNNGIYRSFIVSTTEAAGLKKKIKTENQ